MTRSVRTNTDDAGAKSDAIALLAAAESLDVPVAEVRVITPVPRTAFDVPTTVYDAAVFAENAVTITATITAHDPGGGDNIAVTVTIASVAPEPEHDISVSIAGFNRSLQTGDDLTDDIQFAPPWTGAMVTITDDASGESGEGELVMDGTDGEVVITLEVPVL